MHRVVRIILSILAVLSISCTTVPPQPFDCEAQIESRQRVVKVKNAQPGRYIVVLEEGDPQVAVSERTASTAQEIDALTSSVAARDVEVFATVGSFAASMEAADARALVRDPRVAFVQQDGIKSVDPRVAPEADVTWGLDRIDQRQLPLDDVYDTGDGSAGEGIHVYIIDTGVDTSHAEFEGRIGEGFSVHPFGGFEDDHGHGTHVAGSAGGTEFGVAKKTIIHPVRVLRDGSGADSDVIRGIEWVTAHVVANGWPAVANMSLGGSASDALDLAVCRSIAAGVVHVVASGNDSSDACRSSPARVKQAVGTGASDRDDRRAFFSNKGQCVDVFGPGLNVLSARRHGGSTTLSGTSMASPHAAGVAALCRERHPGASPAEIESCVVDNATPDVLRNLDETSPNLLLFARQP